MPVVVQAPTGNDVSSFFLDPKDIFDIQTIVPANFYSSDTTKSRYETFINKTMRAAKLHRSSVLPISIYEGRKATKSQTMSEDSGQTDVSDDEQVFTGTDDNGGESDTSIGADD